MAARLAGRVVSRPFLCTHANLKEPGHPDGDNPGYITTDYARMAVASGRVTGAWITVLWQEKLPGMVRQMFWPVDAVGVDHVGIGTDLPVSALQAEMPDFVRHREIAAALRDRRMTADEVAKVRAGNWLRVLRVARA